MCTKLSYTDLIRYIVHVSILSIHADKQREKPSIIGLPFMCITRYT